MLSPDRDMAHQPTDLDSSFKDWLGISTDYFDKNFLVSNPGLSPQNYETDTPDRTTVPDRYSFRRGVQDTFNLRARIFAIGPLAIAGYRIVVPAVYMEEPYDYNEEVVNFASRAAQLLGRHRDFFRRGSIVGETPVTVSGPNVNSTAVWTWGSYYIFFARPFFDSPKLVADITREDSYLGTDYQKVLQPGAKGPAYKLFDYISQPVDRRIYYHREGNNFIELYRNEITVQPRISHLIWQTDEAETLKVLYLFVNVTNTATQVEFHYDKGLSPTNVNWSKTISWISSEGNSQNSGTAKFMDLETQTIPPRSFMSVELRR
jgi:hypothetical protein